MQNVLLWMQDHVKEMIILLLIVVIGFLGYFVVAKDENTTSSDLAFSTPVSNDNETEEIPEEIQKTFKVDIKGAVKNPGVYEITEGAIVNDVINLAGGFKSNAYKDGINLSKKVSDEMVIFVYSKENKTNTQNQTQSQQVATQICTVPTYDITECVLDSESVIEVGSSDNSTSDKSPGANESLVVNINTASVSQLTSLSGIGASKAQAIVQYRLEHGNFKTIEDILNVSGIGEAVFAKIKNYITV